MTRPYSHTVQVWTGRASSETVTWGFNVADSNGGFDPTLYGMMKLAVQLTAFSGTLDFQVSVDGGATYNNIPYFQSDTATLGSRSVAQVSYTTSSNYDEYIVPGGPWPIFRIVMTRSAGSITATLVGYEHDSPLAVGDKTGFALSTAGNEAVADAVWDEVVTTHTTQNTFGWGSLRFATKTMTYTGGAGAGVAGGNVNLFDVTGTVLIAAIVPLCTTDLTESGATATITLGVTGNTAVFIAATNSTAIDANEIWTSTTPAVGAIALPAAMKDVVVKAANILNACAVTNTNGGVVRYDVWWLPLSSDGAVTATA